jgi:NAD(P)H-hydrate epimerase
MKPISAEIMSEIDKKAQEDYGIAQIVLMENAGRSAADVVLADLHPLKNERIAIFCGKGNNGGDGFVVGRYLANESPAALTVYVTDIENIRQGAARDNFKIIRKMGIDIRLLEDFLRTGVRETDYTVGIDSIFGTGFRGELPAGHAALGRYLNDSGMKLYAIDVPSGLDATTGTASRDCVRVQKTITFGLPKQGFFAGDGPDVCGEIIAKNIGFPSALLEPYL